MDVTTLKRLTLPELLLAIETSTGNLSKEKENLDSLQGEVRARLEPSVKPAFDQAGKDHGKMTLPLQDGLIADVEIPRTVKWDSAKLQAVAQTLPWERVAAMFKIAFSMPEAIYKGVSALDPALRAKIDDARTETFGAPKITLSRVSQG